MSHHHHGGSSTTGTGSFKKKNRELAEAYWYLVAGVVGLAGITRAVDYVQVLSRCALPLPVLQQLRLSLTCPRRRNAKKEYILSPARPTGYLSQLWATTTAICREATYPQLYVPFRYLTWTSPPPLGRIIILAVYWAVVIYMMAADSVKKDLYFWERVAFRNAWVSVTQVPLVYMLAMKFNPISLITGVSHERLNWLHRWVSRTLFVTATVHGFHFWSQWVIADFVEIELEIMPMVKYGLGAWAVLLWTFVTSFYPVRSFSYEVFVLQHLASAAVFLWLMWKHLPPVAMYNMWLGVGFIAFDRLARWALLAWQNVRFSVGKAPCQGRQRIGHEALVRTEGEGTTVVTVRDAHFKWWPGQHLYLWMPFLGPLEAHPYTIASAHRISGECVCNSVELVVRKHGGFSKRLHVAAQKAQAAGNMYRTTAFVSGPYGIPPTWDVYDTVILISASTGASFTLPILEDMVRSSGPMCLRRVEFLLTARGTEETGFYLGRIRDAVTRAAESEFELCAHIAVTGGSKGSAASTPGAESPSGTSVDCKPDDGTPPEKHVAQMGEKGEEQDGEKTPLRTLTHPDTEILRRYERRVDMDALIRGPVEAARGETLVVVCGGRALVSGVRNCVAGLSDERGVHKGTGAQGIHLHVEEYSF